MTHLWIRNALSGRLCKNTEQGYSVNILEMDTGNAYASCELDINAYIAVFAVDGIQYELNIRSTMDELKKLINSFEYEHI